MKVRLVVLLMVCLSPLSAQKQAAQPPLIELRGVWLTNVDSKVLNSRAGIAEAMRFLAEHKFNVVFPVVWNKGVTLYPSGTMKTLFNIPTDSVYGGRDILAEVLEEAHARNIAVIPWFEFGFAASYNRHGDHLLSRHPSWAAHDRTGKRLSKNGFEWMNPLNPEVQQFMLSLVLEVVDHYPVDGIQGDDRLPAMPVEGGYDELTRSIYQSDHQGKSPPSDFRDSSFLRWRADRLNAFAKDMYQRVKQRKPGLVVSWAPSIFPWSYDEYLQDWPAWVKGGYADLLIPQIYRYSFESYQSTLRTQSSDTLGFARTAALLYPGILMKVGSYVVPPETLSAMIRSNRELGYHGEVFFFYEGLRKNNDRLARLLRSSFYREPAGLPFVPVGMNAGRDLKK